MDEQKYLKGFNDGYFTAKFMPDVRQSMTFKNVDGPTDYQLGYQDGEKEYEREAKKEMSKDGLSKSNDKEKSIDLDR